MSDRIAGSLIQYDADRRFGWLWPDGQEFGVDDIFVHRGEFKGFEPEAGQRFTFEVGEHNGRPCARFVRKERAAEHRRRWSRAQPISTP